MHTEIRKKLDAIVTAQKSTLIARDEEIEGVWLTILAGEHGLLFGPPGVAKSMIVADIARYFPDFQYYYNLMGKTTVPEELYGPVSITRLRQDAYEHNIEGYLPTSDIAFLDEGFKAGATILNTLLRIMNEREFRNGVTHLKVPLKSMFLASNEIPTETELSALYDRILFRFNVQDLRQSTDFYRLLKQEPVITKFLKDEPVATISSKDYVKLRGAVDSVHISDELLGAIVDIRDTLAMNHGVTASSRRWMKSLNGIRAHAAFYGRNEAVMQDLTPLTYMLWSQLDEIPTVKATVWEIANPMLFQLIKFRDKVTEVLDDMDTALQKARKENVRKELVMVEYTSKLRDVQAEIKLAQTNTKEHLNQQGLGAKLQYMLDVIEGAKIRIATEVGGIDPAAVAGKIIQWAPEKVA